MIKITYNEFWSLFNFLNILIYFVMFKLILDNIMDSKVSKTKSILIIILFSFISFISSNHLYILLPVLGFIFIFMGYKYKFFNMVCISILYWNVYFFIIEKIALKLIFYINILGIINTKDETIDIIILESFILKLVLLGMTFFIFLYLKKLKGCGDKLDFFIFIPLLINLGSLLIIYRLVAINNKLNRLNITILIVISVLTLISGIYFFIIIKKLIYNYTIKYENKLIRENISKDYNYYLDIKQQQDRVRELYHDIRNHMIVIKDLSSKADLNGIKTYVETIECSYDKYKDGGYVYDSGNMILDSILNNKSSVCKEKNIDLTVDIDFSQSDFMDMVDICIIFSNIIDNAIEACDKIKDDKIRKEIVIKSRYIDTFCVVSIENSKINELIETQGAIKTSKKDSFIHGIGLKNVENTVKKYFGEIIVRHTEKRFSLKIMIPIKKG